tara:strand:+ start:7128 stop:9311 length:2184 start_codon:yes stop_codon:yes gene_type:complete
MEKPDTCTKLWRKLMTPSDEIDDSIELLPSMDMLALGMLPDLKSNLQRFVRFSATHTTIDRDSDLPEINGVIQGVTEGNEAIHIHRHKIKKKAENGGGGGGNKIATQVGGGKVPIILNDPDSFFGSNIYGTLIASAICVEWLCSPMPRDTVTYKKKGAKPGDIPTKWTCETWSNNSIKDPKKWTIKIPWFSGGTKEIDAGWWQDFLTLSSPKQANTQSHISNIVWSGMLKENVSGGETIKNLYPSSLFVGRGLLQRIERWGGLYGSTPEEEITNRIDEMVTSFTDFVTKILDGDEGKKRMQQWQNRYSLDYQFGDEGDAASALMDLLIEPDTAKKLVTVWYNETEFTFADTSNNKLGAGSVVEELPDPRKNLVSSEDIDKLYGDFSYDGLVYKLLKLIQIEKQKMGGPVMEGVFSIFDGENITPNAVGEPHFARQRVALAKGKIIGGFEPPDRSMPKDADLVEYLKSLIGWGGAVVDAATVLHAIYETGIYMIVNLPSHGHTALVLFKNNKIYTAGAGLWGADVWRAPIDKGGNKKLLCFSPDDTIFVDTSGGLASTEFQEGDKKIHEPNIITKVGFINEKLLENLTTFAVSSDFVVDKFTLESTKYNYNRTNLYTDNPPTLSCSSWVWLMVEGNVKRGIRKPVSLNNPYSRRGPFYGISTNQLNQEGVSITSKKAKDKRSSISIYLDSIGGGKKNTRRKRRRKRKRTKRSIPNKKKRTKKAKKKTK